jgi:hypothetical protein
MAEGSHATRGDYPSHCAGCGKQVRVTIDNCWYEHDHDTGEKKSWHMSCRHAALVGKTVR